MQKDLPLLDPEQFAIARQALIDKNKAMHFSSGIVLSEDEQKLDAQLASLRDELYKQVPNPVLKEFYTAKPSFEASPLFAFLDRMPKGGVHHLHLTAGCHVDFLIQLTYEDVVFYNEQTKVFRIEPTGVATEEGFRRANEVRKEKESAAAFDAMIREDILLNQGEIRSQHTETIWQHF